MLFRAFDLGESFREGGIGYLQHRIVNHDGELILSAELWKAGLFAYKFLQDSGVDVLDAAVVREWLRYVNKEFGDLFFEQIQEIVNSPNFHFEGGSKEDFFEAWPEYGWTDKLRCALEFFDQFPLYEMPDGAGLIKRHFMVLSAFGVLGRIDSAAISERFDGDGLFSNAADVLWFWSRIDPPKHVLNLIGEAKKTGRKEVSSRALEKRHAENRMMKQDVFKWLDNNINSFKSMDAAAEAIAGNVVPLTFRTARDWVGEWKKLRSTRTP